jgi:hypothetical protein
MSKKNNISFLQKMIYLLDDQIKKIPFLLFLFIALSLLDIIGLGLILPYVSLIINPEEFQSSQIAQYFGLKNLHISIENLTILMGFIIFFIFLVKGL